MIEVIYSRRQIRIRVRQLAQTIRDAYAGKEMPYVIILMNGAMFFAADLLRSLRMPVQYDVLAVKSYDGDASSGKLEIRSQLKGGIRGKNILLIDDILDTGLTLLKTKEFLLAEGAVQVRTCVLLDKRVPGKQCTADWAGFRIKPFFAVGYGLDYNENYRTLPYIGNLIHESE